MRFPGRHLCSHVFIQRDFYIKKPLPSKFRPTQYQHVVTIYQCHTLDMSFLGQACQPPLPVQVEGLAQPTGGSPFDLPERRAVKKKSEKKSVEKQQLCLQACYSHYADSHHAVRLRISEAGKVISDLGRNTGSSHCFLLEHTCRTQSQASD